MEGPNLRDTSSAINLPEYFSGGPSDVTESSSQHTSVKQVDQRNLFTKKLYYVSDFLSCEIYVKEYKNETPYY